MVEELLVFSPEAKVIQETLGPCSSFASILVKLNNSSKWIIWMSTSFFELLQGFSLLSCPSDES